MRHLALLFCFAVSTQAAQTIEVPFQTHDGHPMRGKLTLPDGEARYGVVIYVQTAEGATVDMKRPLGTDRTFHYYDLYREKLPSMNVAFFSYEGRGVTMGDAPPRYETIDRAVYDSSTLENKVRDILSAVAVVKAHPRVDASRIFLMGASEGTYLAAEAASRSQDVAGAILYAVLSTTLKDALYYQGADGPFLVFRRVFDANRDGAISTEEFAAESRRTARQTILPNVEFSQLDADKDGSFTQTDYRTLRKGYLDAVEAANIAVIERQLGVTASVAIPKGWLQDHFAHADMWSFLDKISGPVGFFHGDADNLTPIAGVKALEERSRAAGKTNFEFHYFEGLDHSLNIGEWFARQRLPAGHAAMFDFMQRRIATQ